MSDNEWVSVGFKWTWWGCIVLSEQVREQHVSSDGSSRLSGFNSSLHLHSGPKGTDAASRQEVNSWPTRTTVSCLLHQFRFISSCCNNVSSPVCNWNWEELKYSSVFSPRVWTDCHVTGWKVAQGLELRFLYIWFSSIVICVVCDAGDSVSFLTVFRSFIQFLSSSCYQIPDVKTFVCLLSPPPWMNEVYNVVKQKGVGCHSQFFKFYFGITVNITTLLIFINFIDKLTVNHLILCHQHSSSSELFTHSWFRGRSL